MGKPAEGQVNHRSTVTIGHVTPWDRALTDREVVLAGAPNGSFALHRSGGACENSQGIVGIAPTNEFTSRPQGGPYRPDLPRQIFRIMV